MEPCPKCHAVAGRCNGLKETKKYGIRQRYTCKECGYNWFVHPTEAPDKPIDDIPGTETMIRRVTNGKWYIYPKMTKEDAEEIDALAAERGTDPFIGWGCIEFLWGIDDGPDAECQGVCSGCQYRNKPLPFKDYVGKSCCEMQRYRI